MADQPQQNPQGQQGRQIQLRIDESHMATAYANTIRTSTTMDEVVMDFGLNMPQAGPNNEPVMLFAVGSRVIMNWAGAKRLAGTLNQAVNAYEQQHGEITLERPRSAGPGGGQPPLQ